MDARMTDATPTSRPAAKTISPIRLTLVVHIETALLVLRYLGYAMLLLAFAFEYPADYMPPLVPVTIGLIVHNVWVHGVLYVRRYDLLIGPVNFCLHLLAITHLIALTGAEESPLVVMYPVFLIGYALYSTEFRGVYRAAFLCGASYAFAILGNWTINGINPAYNPMLFGYITLAVSAWLMSNLGEMIRRLEIEADKRAMALASSEAMLRTILNSTADPIIVFNEAEFITEVNDRACEYLEVPRHTLVGRRFRSVLFDDGTLPNKLAALRSRGEYWGELIVAPEEGEERTAALMARSFIRDNRRFFVAMLHDITEQKSLQEASRIANLQLEQINETLQQVNAMRMAFFTDISQRLRSPLSAIVGFNEMLLNEELGEVNPEQRQALQSCRRSLQRVFELANEATSLGEPVLPEDVRTPETTPR